MNIGELIKSRRIEKGWTLEEMAKRIGVTAATISRWESGKIEDMKRSRIKALSEALGIPINVIMGWEEEETPEPYYFDQDARDLADFLHKNPDYKVLFDASRRVKKEDIDFVRQMIDRMSGDS